MTDGTGPPDCCDGILERDEGGEWWVCSPDCEESYRGCVGCGMRIRIEEECRCGGDVEDDLPW